MTNPQANTRAHHLSNYGSLVAPDNWNDEDAGYNPILVQIWAAWRFHCQPSAVNRPQESVLGCLGTLLTRRTCFSLCFGWCCVLVLPPLSRSLVDTLIIIRLVNLPYSSCYFVHLPILAEAWSTPLLTRPTYHIHLATLLICLFYNDTYSLLRTSSLLLLMLY